MSTLKLTPVSDIKTGTNNAVSAADQAKINKFARLNNRSEDLKTELKKVKNELDNLKDAGDEIMLNGDDIEVVPLKIGDTFVAYPVDDIQSKLDSLTEDKEKSMTKLESEVDELKEEMKQLKVELYAKFGSAINLEPDDAE